MPRQYSPDFRQRALRMVEEALPEHVNQQGLRGVKRSKRVFTTKPDPVGARPLDLVNRNFNPNTTRRLWVANITYVRTWQGFAYVAFVTDAVSRRIVGWNVAQTLKADILPRQALEMAAFQHGDGGLTHHSDHGSTTWRWYTDRVSELGAAPSTGTIGDSYDCENENGRWCWSDSCLRAYD